jgi:hypothetical protein
MTQLAHYPPPDSRSPCAGISRECDTPSILLPGVRCMAWPLRGSNPARPARCCRVRLPRRKAQPQKQNPGLALRSTRRIHRQASLVSAAFDASASAGRHNHCDYRRRTFAASSGHVDTTGRWFLPVSCRTATCGAGKEAPPPRLAHISQPTNGCNSASSCLAPSKRGKRSMPASPLGGTRQSRRRSCAPQAGKDKGKRS